MARQDVIDAQVAAIQSAELAALQAGIGAGYDAGLADGQIAAGVSPAQEAIDIQAAVAAAVAPLNNQLALLQADDSAKAQVLATVQSLQQQLAALFPAPPSS